MSIRNEKPAARSLRFAGFAIFFAISAVKALFQKA
jgi:hypothetical protein